MMAQHCLEKYSAECAEVDLFLTYRGRRKIGVWPLNFETSD